VSVDVLLRVEVDSSVSPDSEPAEPGPEPAEPPGREVGMPLNGGRDTDTEAGGLVSPVAVTGQIVVYKEMISVVTCPTWQFVTVGAQDVTVWIYVVYTVEVVYGVVSAPPGLDAGPAGPAGVVSVAVTGHTVV